MEIKSVKRSNAQRPSELRTRLNAKCKERKISIEKDAYSYFMVSYSTLNRRLSSEDIIEPAIVKKLAEFIEASEDDILRWHGYTKEAVTSTDQTIIQKPYNYRKAILINVIIFTLLILTYVVIMNSRLFSQTNTPTIYTAEYSGNGTDVGLAKTRAFKDFHSRIYNYKFENVTTKITDENITLLCDLTITSIIDPNIKYIGKFSSEGKYLNGNAALAYEIIDKNKEKWIGVMMLKIPTMGHAKGYWLTIHNDADNESTGSFSLGNANLKRVVARPVT